MLLIVIFKIAKFAIKFVQIVFVLLDHGLRLVDSGKALGELILFLSE